VWLFLNLLFIYKECIEEKVNENIQECYKLEKSTFIPPEKTDKNETKIGLIQSPNYPDKYSKNIACIYALKGEIFLTYNFLNSSFFLYNRYFRFLRILAPRNYIVILKNFSKFDLEPSPECGYDYLEIRDGPYGYSPLIGRYCNNNPLALPVESSGQELWLKFNTDDTIQSHGFQITYEFVKLSNAQMIIKSFEVNPRLISMQLILFNLQYEIIFY
jgi:hypothetical protein